MNLRVFVLRYTDIYVINCDLYIGYFELTSSIIGFVLRKKSVGIVFVENLLITWCLLHGVCIVRFVRLQK